MGLNIVSAHFAFVKNVKYVVVMRYIEQFILAINRARNRINKMLTWDVTSWKPHNHNLPQKARVNGLEWVRVWVSIR